MVETIIYVGDTILFPCSQRRVLGLCKDKDCRISVGKNSKTCFSVKSKTSSLPTVLHDLRKVVITNFVLLLEEEES